MLLTPDWTHNITADLRVMVHLKQDLTADVERFSALCQQRTRE